MSYEEEIQKDIERIERFFSNQDIIDIINTHKEPLQSFELMNIMSDMVMCKVLDYDYELFENMDVSEFEDYLKSIPGIKVKTVTRTYVNYKK